MSGSSEWTVVTKSSKRRIARPKKQDLWANSLGDLLKTTHQPWTEEMSEKCLKQIFVCVEHLQASGFHEALESALSNTRGDRSNDSVIRELVCYGIGNFSISYSPSMWQLACALCLRRILDDRKVHSIEEESTSKVDVVFFDPCITPTETEILQQRLNLNVLSINERGKRRVQATGRCLFFMPHCPRPMYENVLWANWDCLERVVLIGNSLHAYDGRISNDRTESGIPSVLPFVKECQLNLSKQDEVDLQGNVERAFNDCFLSEFAIEDSSLPARPSEYVWQASDEVL